MRAIMRDVKNFPAAKKFDGFRFASSRCEKGAPSFDLPDEAFADADTKFLLWGYGKRAW